MLTMDERAELMRAMGWKGTGETYCWWTTPDGTRRRNWLNPDESAADAMAVLTWMLSQGLSVLAESSGGVQIEVDSQETFIRGGANYAHAAVEGDVSAQTLREAIGQAGLEVARRMAQDGPTEDTGGGKVQE